MKLAHIWRRKGEPTASHFVPALDRVREMRDQAGWEPLADPATIQQRAERVATARKQVVIPRLAPEPEPRLPQKSSRVWMTELLVVPVVVAIFAFLAFLTIVVAAFLVSPIPEPAKSVRSETSTIIIPVSESYARLTDARADVVARKALVSRGFDLEDWFVVRMGDPASEDIYLQRISENEGLIHFENANDGARRLAVSIKLEPEAKRIVCIIYSN